MRLSEKQKVGSNTQGYDLAILIPLAMQIRDVDFLGKSVRGNPNNVGW